MLGVIKWDSFFLIPPTQLVDRSSCAYNEQRHPPPPSLFLLQIPLGFGGGRVRRESGEKPSRAFCIVVCS